MGSRPQTTSRHPVARWACSIRAQSVAKPRVVLGVVRVGTTIRVWAWRRCATCAAWARSRPTRSRDRLVRKVAFSSRNRLTRGTLACIVGMGFFLLCGG